MFDSCYNDVKRTHPQLYAAYRDSLIKKALDILQKAQRYDPANTEEMQACSQGDWISINDVMNAIKILQDKEK